MFLLWLKVQCDKNSIKLQAVLVSNTSHVLGVTLTEGFLVLCYKLIFPNCCLLLSRW